jgi:putative membrane protein
MFVSYRGSILGTMGWQWRYILFFTLSSSLIVWSTKVAPAEWSDHIQLPGLPLGVLGGAIGIFTSFRTNSAYDRWWEGRKLWGALVNNSRHWASQVLNYASPGEGTPSELQIRLVRRHIGYVHLLRTVLRRQPLDQDPDVLRFLSLDDVSSLKTSTNPTSALLHLQMKELQAEVRHGRLDLLHHQLLDLTIRELLDVQGGCERIKNTPFPRGYGFIAERLIVAFSLLLPMGMAQDMGWATVPMSLLVCTGFLLINEIGRVLEDPFTMFWPALPLSALSTTIELNLRERLGERDLPGLPKENAKGILM